MDMTDVIFGTTFTAVCSSAGHGGIPHTGGVGESVAAVMMICFFFFYAADTATRGVQVFFSSTTTKMSNKEAATRVIRAFRRKRADILVFDY